MADNQDSLEFFAKYKGWTAVNKMPVTDKTSAIEVAEYLSSVRHAVDTKAFEIIGIDTGSLDSYSKKLTKGHKPDASEIVDAYKSMGNAEGKAEMERAARGKEELKPFVQAYLLRSILANLDFDFRIDTNKQRIFNHGLSPDERRTANQRFGISSKAGTKGKQADEQSENASEAVYFLAKYKDWVCIKKMNIRENTDPAEVAAHLGTIRLAIDRKACQLLGINMELLELYAEKATKSMRKSAQNLGKMLEVLDSPEAKREISNASLGDPKLAEIARICLFTQMSGNIGFDIEVNPEVVGKVYPQLKIPKPKGRMPGQRKKHQ